MPADLDLVCATPRSAFAEAMSALASGVVVVTTWLGDRPWGTTVTAFASVSASPPTVLVSLRSGSAAARAIEATGRFGVSILASSQLAVARYASAPGAPKFIEPFSEQAGGGMASPVVEGALAHLDCRLAERIEVADHTVFFGRVRAVRAPLAVAPAPLVYHRRDYTTLAGRKPCTWREERAAWS